MYWFHQVHIKKVVQTEVCAPPRAVTSKRVQSQIGKKFEYAHNYEKCFEGQILHSLPYHPDTLAGPSIAKTAKWPPTTGRAR